MFASNRKNCQKFPCLIVKILQGKITFDISGDICRAPADIFACACCADAGTYVISTKKPTSFEFGELAKIKFGTTNLFTTPGYPDDLKGIALPGENFFSQWLASKQFVETKFQTRAKQIGNAEFNQTNFDGGVYGGFARQQRYRSRRKSLQRMAFQISSAKR